MSVETLVCGKRTYDFESRVTKNGHKFIMIVEKSSGRISKVMVFHDHFELFRAALERIAKAEPSPVAPAAPLMAVFADRTPVAV
jgi:hypothetical protein